MIDWTQLKTVEIKQAESDQQAREQRIAELKRFLSKTDFKFNVDYDEQETPEWETLKTQRQQWRDEIRILELKNGG